MQADGEEDFTSIWVLTPMHDGKVKFEVYQEFSLSAVAGNENDITLTAPPDGYGTPVATSPGVLDHN